MPLELASQRAAAEGAVHPPLTCAVPYGALAGPR